MTAAACAGWMELGATVVPGLCAECLKEKYNNSCQHLVSYLHVHEFTKLIVMLNEARSEVSLINGHSLNRYFTAFSMTMLLYKGLQYEGDCFVSYSAALRAFRAMTGLDGACSIK